jgi:hypothetical protein
VSAGPAAGERAAGRVLHVTNGDAAGDKIRAAGLADGPGDVVLPWRDVLHDGPVPEGDEAVVREARVAFIVSRAWGLEADVRRSFAERDATLAGAAAYGEVVLWFEHDLYDQLQLLQVLDALSRVDRGAGRWSAVLAAEYLGPASPERLRELWAARAPLTGAQLALGRRGWAAFRASDPRALEALLADDTSPVPHLASALRRHLQNFPSTRNGLSRSEQQALDALADGPRTLEALFPAATHEREEAVFLGDSSFLHYLEALGAGPESLVTWDDGTPLVPRHDEDAARAVWQRQVALTDAGRAVRDAKRDWIDMLRAVPGYEGRWLGGVHLHPEATDWRWDDEGGRLTVGPR